VDLPRAFGSGEASAKAIAISADGSRLYAIDTDQGLIAAMDTQRLKVVGVQHVDLGLGESGQSVASVSGDGGTLYVGRGSTVVELSLEDMKPVQRWSLGGDTTGLATTSDRLYAATPNAVRILNPATGAQIRSVPVSGVTGIAYLGAATG
jgi:sugar lactone lactonase YvrE